MRSFHSSLLLVVLPSAVLGVCVVLQEEECTESPNCSWNGGMCESNFLGRNKRATPPSRRRRLQTRYNYDHVHHPDREEPVRELLEMGSRGSSGSDTLTPEPTYEPSLGGLGPDYYGSDYDSDYDYGSYYSMLPSKSPAWRGSMGSDLDPSKAPTKGRYNYGSDGGSDGGDSPECLIESSYDYPGSDIALVKTTSATDCAIECMNYDGCLSWTYLKNVSLGAHRIGECYLKDAVQPNRVPNNCCDSGLPCVMRQHPGYGSDGGSDGGDSPEGEQGSKYNYGSDDSACIGVSCPAAPDCPEGSALYTTPRSLFDQDNECCNQHVCNPLTCGELEFLGKSDGCCGVPHCSLPEVPEEGEPEARGEPAPVGIIKATTTDEQGSTSANDDPVDPLRWGEYLSQDSEGNQLHWKMDKSSRPQNYDCRQVSLDKLPGDCKEMGCEYPVTGEGCCESLQDGGDRGNPGSNKENCIWSSMTMKAAAPGDDYGSVGRLEVTMVRDSEDNISRECQLFYNIMTYNPTTRRLTSQELPGNIYTCLACIPGQTCVEEETSDA